MSDRRNALNYVYVDNSNLFIEGQRASAVRRAYARSIVDAMNHGVLDFEWNLDYEALYEVVCGQTVAVACARLWGSPPPYDSFWDMVKRHGWDVAIFERSAGGKEKKVDTSITYRMTKDAYTTIDRRSSEITLVAGDRDYAPAVQDLVAEGFSVTVAFWGHAAKELRTVASDFFCLDNYVDIVGRRRPPRSAA